MTYLDMARKVGPITRKVHQKRVGGRIKRFLLFRANVGCQSAHGKVVYNCCSFCRQPDYFGLLGLISTVKILKAGIIAACCSFCATFQLQQKGWLLLESGSQIYNALCTQHPQPVVGKIAQK